MLKPPPRLQASAGVFFWDQLKLQTMRINKEEARMLAHILDCTLTDWVQGLQDAEERGHVPEKTAKRCRLAGNAMLHVLSEFGEDKRGEGRWNPNTSDLSTGELALRVWNRRKKHLDGDFTAHGIYFNPSDVEK